jgi:hypothetical protein
MKKEIKKVIGKNADEARAKEAEMLKEFATKLKSLCDEYGYDIEAKGYLDVVKKK